MHIAIYQMLHNLIYSSLCIAMLLLLKRPLLKNGGHFCLFYLWLLPLFALCNPISFIVPTPWGGIRQSQLISYLSLNSSLIYALLAIWLIGAVVSIILVIVKMKKTVRYLLALTEKPDEITTELFSQKKAALCIKRRVNLLITDLAISPMIVLAKDPIILLPNVNFSKASLELVLEHELYHLKYKDIYIKAFALLVRAAFWWNPLVYIVVDQMEEACELTCDYRVLQGKAPNVCMAYSHTILSLVKYPLDYHDTFGTTALSSSILVRRFELMLKPKQLIKRGLVLSIAFLMFSCSFLTFRAQSKLTVPEMIIAGSYDVVERLDGLYDIYDKAGNMLFYGVDDTIRQKIAP